MLLSKEQIKTVLATLGVLWAIHNIEALKPAKDILAIAKM